MSATLALSPDWTHAREQVWRRLPSSWMQSHVTVVPEDAPLSDAECMQRYRNGDGHAFRILYARHRQKLHRYALRLAGKPCDAEELFQDIWMAVVHAKDRYEPSASFVAWLFGIAHRRAADRWRVLARHAPDALDAHGSDDALEHHAASPTSMPDRHVDSDALGRALVQAVQSLPLPQREAFLMKAEGELSLDDIATATGTTRETVKSRLRYAQQKLREALQPWR